MTVHWDLHLIAGRTDLSGISQQPLCTPKKEGKRLSSSLLQLKDTQLGNAKRRLDLLFKPCFELAACTKKGASNIWIILSKLSYFLLTSGLLLHNAVCLRSTYSDYQFNRFKHSRTLQEVSDCMMWPEGFYIFSKYFPADLQVTHTPWGNVCIN